MKKGNQNFKVLTRAEANQVKGGGWLSNMLKSWYNRYQEDKAAREAAEAEERAMAEEGFDCPPPPPPMG